jgi:hypothetical protein
VLEGVQGEEAAAAAAADTATATATIDELLVNTDPPIVVTAAAMKDGDEGVATRYEPMVENISDVESISTGVENMLELVPKEAGVGALDVKEIDLALGVVVQAANVVAQVAPSTSYAAAAAGMVKRTRAAEVELPKRKDKKQKRGNGLSPP